MMPSHKTMRIAILPGDGIGQEVMALALPVFDRLSIPVHLMHGEIGWLCWQQEGAPIPERTWRLIAEADCVLLGAITSKPIWEAEAALMPVHQQQGLQYVSPLIQLRQTLDLFVNVRPCFSVAQTKTPFHFCIIRENTEGLYAGFDFSPLPSSLHQLISQDKRWQTCLAEEMACSLRIQTKKGLYRLFEFAFNYARKQGMQRVTWADKVNVLRQSGAFAHQVFCEVASAFPDILADCLQVDAVAMQLVRAPERFGVIVAENMFGDILSDVGASVMGGLGFAPSANLGKNGAYFEPVHGSAPHMPTHRANPCAMFLSIGLLLEHFNYPEAAKKIKEAVCWVVNDGRFVTPDAGGKASNEVMTEAILEACIEKPGGKIHRFSPTKASMSSPWHALLAFSASEISDALDACSIEGALYGIKPLFSGMKMAGPAYTVRYVPRKLPVAVFKKAADYIDKVPPCSVIVIDNAGRTDCTVWGDILTSTALKKEIAGTVVYGSVRDINALSMTSYPLYCTGVYMRSGKNRVYKAEEQAPLIIQGVKILPGDIIFADDHGVLVIPALRLNEVIEKARIIQINEEKIKTAVRLGASLKEARKRFAYHKPWVLKEEN